MGRIMVMMVDNGQDVLGAVPSVEGLYFETAPFCGAASRVAIWGRVEAPMSGIQNQWAVESFAD